MKKIIIAVALVAGMLGATVGAAEAYPHHGWGQHRHCTGWGWRDHHHDRYCRGWGI